MILAWPCAESEGSSKDYSSSDELGVMGWNQESVKGTSSALPL
jgi:hypothetical protein